MDAEAFERDRLSFVVGVGNRFYTVGRRVTFTAGTRLLHRWAYIAILDDTVAEGDETFEMTLTAAHGAAIATPAATITITDND